MKFLVVLPKDTYANISFDQCALDYDWTFKLNKKPRNHRFRIDAIFPPGMILLLLKEFMDFSKDF